MALTKVSSKLLKFNFNIGHCRLAYVSTTSIKLSPYNGNGLSINGNIYSIPSGGVSLANTGLTAATLYYIYAYMNGDVMTLEASATGYSTSALTGITIKTGDETRTLVGMVYMNTGTPGTFSDAATHRYVRSWFNDPGFNGLNTFTADRSTASTSYVELNTEIRCQFISWSNEIIRASVNGTSEMAGGSSHTAIAFDGSTAQAGFEGSGTVHYSSGPINIGISGTLTGLSEGYHYATLIGKNSGGTSTWKSSTATVFSKVYIHVSGKK